MNNVVLILFIAFPASCGYNSFSTSICDVGLEECLLCAVYWSCAYELLFLRIQCTFKFLLFTTTKNIIIHKGQASSVMNN